MQRWIPLGAIVFVAACKAASFDVVLSSAPTPFVPAISATPIGDATIPPTPPEPIPTDTAIDESVTLGTCVPVRSTLVGSSGTFRVVAPGFPGVVGRRVLLHQTQHSTPSVAGTFEVRMLGAIGSSSGNLVLLFTEELTRHYSSEAASDRAQVCTVETFDFLAIGDTVKINGPAWNGSAGGILAIRASSLSNGGTIDMTGRGFRGGDLSESDGVDFNGLTTIDETEAAEKGEGTDASLVGLRGRGSANNGGGGGNAGVGFQGAGGGGAGAGKGGDGGGDPASMKLGAGGTFGGGRASFGGGGGGGYATFANAGAGGTGGGFLYIDVAGSFQSDATASLRASGVTGVGGSGGGAGAGGGGGGGVIEIHAADCTGTFSMIALGGAGGPGSGSPTYGGGGWIRHVCMAGGIFSEDVGPGAGGDADPNGVNGEIGVVGETD